MGRESVLKVSLIAAKGCGYSGRTDSFTAAWPRMKKVMCR